MHVLVVGVCTRVKVECGVCGGVDGSRNISTSVCQITASVVRVGVPLPLLSTTRSRPAHYCTARVSVARFRRNLKISSSSVDLDCSLVTSREATGDDASAYSKSRRASFLSSKYQRYESDRLEHNKTHLHPSEPEKQTTPAWRGQLRGDDIAGIF